MSKTDRIEPGRHAGPADGETPPRGAKTVPTLGYTTHLLARRGTPSPQADLTDTESLWDNVPV